ncbi:MAG: AzlD domain-containing protein [Deltaproteobacteria bacterium]|nr:AzlD domain-containing protein [Deltaproteobacteria bacterium]
MTERYWLAVALVAGGTLVFRLMFLGGRRRPELPWLVIRSLDYIPPAVLAALIAPEFLNFSSPDPAALAAGLTAVLISLRFKRDFTAIVLGFIAYMLVNKLFL